MPASGIYRMAGYLMHSDLDVAKALAAARAARAAAGLQVASDSFKGISPAVAGPMPPDAQPVVMGYGSGGVKTGSTALVAAAHRAPDLSRR